MKVRCVSVISLITDKWLGAIKLSILSVNNRKVEVYHGN